MAFNPSIQMSVSSRNLGSAHPGTMAGQGICRQIYLWLQELLLQGVGLEQCSIFLPDPNAEEQSRLSKGGENTLLFVLLRPGQNPGAGDGTVLKENCQDKKRKGNQKVSVTCDAAAPEERW